MADNVTLPATGTGTADIAVATDKVTYSGDADQNVQLMRPVLVTGAEGAKTVVDLPGDNTNGLDVDVTRLPALVAGTALVGKVSIDQVSANANEVVVKTGSTTAVTQATGTNLHTVVDSGTITTVSTVTAVTAISNALPAGNNNIGDVDVASIAAGDNNIGNVDIVTMPNVVIGSGTVTAVTAITNALPAGTNVIGHVIVDTTSTTAVTQATASNLNCTEASASAIKTSTELIDDAIFADDNAFTIGTSKVMASGNYAVAHGSDPDSADAGDAVIAIANRHRVPFIIGGHPNVVCYGMSATTAISNTVIGPTVNTGSKLVVTRFTCTLDNASTVFPSVVVGFGTANTPAIATTPGTAQIIATHAGVAAGGGFNVGDGSGIVGIGADDQELRITTVGNATGLGLYFSFSGYTIPT